MTTYAPTRGASEGPALKQWARVRDDVSCHLRRGAWCPVVKMTDAEVVLEAGGREVTIERARVIISTARPNRWSVIALPGDAVNVPPQWGLHYAVCPACAHRAPLGTPAPRKRCSRCGDTFPLEGEEP